MVTLVPISENTFKITEFIDTNVLRMVLVLMKTTLDYLHYALAWLSLSDPAKYILPKGWSLSDNAKSILPKGWWGRFGYYLDSYDSTGFEMNKKQFKRLNMLVYKAITYPSRDMRDNMISVNSIIVQLHKGSRDFRPESTYSTDSDHNGHYRGVVTKLNQFSREYLGGSMFFNLRWDSDSYMIPNPSKVSTRVLKVTYSESVTSSIWKRFTKLFDILIMFLLCQEKTWKVRTYLLEMDEAVWSSKPCRVREVAEESSEYLMGELRAYRIEVAVFQEFMNIFVTDSSVHPQGVIENIELWKLQWSSGSKEFYPRRSSPYAQVTAKINNFALKNFESLLITKSVFDVTRVK